MSLLAGIGARIERLGWSETARRSGVDRISLHRCFGNCGGRNPKLRTLERVLPVLGLELVVRERVE